MTEMRSFRVRGISSVLVALSVKLHGVQRNDSFRTVLFKNQGSGDCNGKIGICNSIDVIHVMAFTLLIGYLLQYPSVFSLVLLMCLRHCNSRCCTPVGLL
jgi:hypothetical protein